MKNLINKNGKTMNGINVNAASQQVADGLQNVKNSLRIVKMKQESNEKMVKTMQKAIALGVASITITPRVDVAGCGYAWLGLRKGQTELQGKLLLNAQVWNYLLAFLLGEELPEVTAFDSDKEICCQGEWLEKLEEEIQLHTTKQREEYTVAEDGTGYLSHSWLFPNGKVKMPAEELEDVTALLA